MAPAGGDTAGRRSSIASTAQQLSLSFGVAIGSLTAAWFLGHVDQTDPAATIPALHRAFFTLGAITIVSSLAFLRLHPHDGNNISHRQPLPPPRGQLRADSRAEVGTPPYPAEEYDSRRPGA